MENKVCKTCQKEQSLDSYYIETHQNGRTHHKLICKTCILEKQKELREIPNSVTKVCIKCLTTKTLDCFGCHPHDKSKPHYYCKECLCNIQKITKEKIKANNIRKEYYNIIVRLDSGENIMIKKNVDEDTKRKLIRNNFSFILKEDKK